MRNWVGRKAGGGALLSVARRGALLLEAMEISITFSTRVHLLLLGSPALMQATFLLLGSRRGSLRG